MVPRYLLMYYYAKFAPLDFCLATTSLIQPPITLPCSLLTTISVPYIHCYHEVKLSTIILSHLQLSAN